MGRVWTGEPFFCKKDKKTYILNLQRVYAGKPKAYRRRRAPGQESKLTTQVYFDYIDGSLVRPECNCTWDERRSGHVCTRKVWRMLDRQARRTKNRRLR